MLLPFHLIFVVLAMVLAIAAPKFGESTLSTVLEILFALLLPEIYLLVYLVLALK